MTDQTFYPDPGEISDKLDWKLSPATNDPAPPALDVMFAFIGDAAKEKLQRGIVCSCYAKQHCAVTARETDRLASKVSKTPRFLTKPDLSGYVTRDKLLQWPTDVDRKRRVENALIVRTIWQLVCTWDVAPPGLIVVAGETGTRKTAFAREIARRHISHVMRAEHLRPKPPDVVPERPHIVTYEDPIESWFADSPAQASEAGFEYTPRQKGRDVGDLKETIVNALRQKPALLYVNEVRDDEDWRSLLFFAGTGHLAITTTHAGSLVETFGRILGAAHANTSVKRSEIASRIVAIIHVRKLEGEFVPALWVQTPRTRMALTQEGLGSLLPSREGGCFGRAHFVKALRLKDNDRKVFKAAVKVDLVGG